MDETETRVLIPQEIMNHCFDDVEQFMARLQQAAEAQHYLSQKAKKRSKKRNKKEEPGGESDPNTNSNEFLSVKGGHLR